MKEKHKIVQQLHNVLYYYMAKKLYTQFHLMTKRVIKKGKNKSYKKSRMSFLMSYTLTYAFIMIAQAVKLQQKMVMASQQSPELKSGGIVKGGELVNLPDGKQIIPHDIAKQIAKSTMNKNFKVVIDVKDSGINVDYLKRKLNERQKT